MDSELDAELGKEAFERSFTVWHDMHLLVKNMQLVVLVMKSQSLGPSHLIGLPCMFSQLHLPMPGDLQMTLTI